MKIQENIALAPWTTFRVGGPARYFVDAAAEEDVIEALALAHERSLPLFVLGGGSNILVADRGWPGLVLKISIGDLEFYEDAGALAARVGAGESWDNFVAQAVLRNCAGVECLSGIPGTVGGTPVQNVGAYGQEVSETITGVRVLETASGKILELGSEECGFAYRASIFNSVKQGQYIVTRVAFRLYRDRPPKIEYADLRQYFAGCSQPTLEQTRDAVRSIRHAKAMLIMEGDEDCRSAGSFFKNPIVSRAEAESVQAIADRKSPEKKLPVYPADHGLLKLSAAWLVEQSGFYKGYASGPAAISRKHALAIVNRGGAKAEDICALQAEIQQRVLEAWGIRLIPEPVFVGFERDKV